MTGWITEIKLRVRNKLILHKKNKIHCQESLKNKLKNIF